MENKTCLVTGGAGFIGCAISSRLADRFDRVVAVDNLHPQIHPRAERPVALDPRVEFMVRDVTNPDHWSEILNFIQPHVVVHLAAETGTGQSLTEATRHASVNVVGTTLMLDALSQYQIFPEAILLTSSRAVYGEGAWRRRDGEGTIYPGQRTRAQLERGEWDFPGLQPMPFTAGVTEPRPTSVYGATKLAQEYVLGAWCLSFNVKPIILRLQNVYGPGQSLINPYTGIVSLFCRLAREGKSIPVYEDGAIVRDFVFIDDVAAAIDRALAHSSHLPLGRIPYDVGSGEPVTIAEVADWISKRYGASSPHVNGAFRYGDVRHAACTIERTVKDLGWAPAWSLYRGLEALVEWIEVQLQPK
ncbi:dTDP-L-rhamnose 4-epimerase [Microvirga flocculans]|uniref:dTDP-L-rhamnose 4-epimerase n=1 Tax=Microvirga flocculans TaxID=217168 RepID=A0A7W6IHB9_9HYPH|nr:NAD-dependent epimerase/dehydratase family protein [Microvirga flocculans]MBB4041502.1 dTDP-L-rhamnose 4-epimerase [Microvirga flocculans]